MWNQNVLDKLAHINDAVPSVTDDYICCNKPMYMTSDSEYVCSECGLVREAEDRDCHEISSVVWFNTGSNGKKRLNVNSVRDSQYFAVLRDMKKILQSHDVQIPESILIETAQYYNIIYQHAARNGDIINRGDKRDDVIAVLLYYTCFSNNYTIRKIKIAEIMGLRSKGFSVADNIVRKYIREKVVNIKIDIDIVTGFAKRYLKNLDIYTPDRESFVCECVNTAIEHFISPAKQVITKVTGAIWALIVGQNLQISPAEIEALCDDVKFATFKSFHKDMLSFPSKFGPIFAKYGVAYY